MYLRGDIIGESFTSGAISALLGSLNPTNSLQEVWGDDANVWNPWRFLNGDREKQASIGVFANL